MAITNLSDQVTCHLAANGSLVTQRSAEPTVIRPTAQRQAQRKPVMRQQTAALYTQSNKNTAQQQQKNTALQHITVVTA